MSLSCTVFEILTLINLRIRGSADRQINAIAALDVGRHLLQTTVPPSVASRCDKRMVVVVSRSAEMKSIKSLKRIGSQKPDGRRRRRRPAGLQQYRAEHSSRSKNRCAFTEIIANIFVPPCTILFTVYHTLHTALRITLARGRAHYFLTFDLHFWLTFYLMRAMWSRPYTYKKV